MNILHIAGRIGKDAEIRFTQGGDPVCSFDVAVDSRVKGEKVTTWVRCTIWGERAEKLGPYLTKGTAIAVAGEAKATAYTPRDSDKPRGVLEIRVDRVTLLGGGGEQQERPQQNRQDRSPPPRQEPQQDPPADFEDDFNDPIPF